MADEMREVRRAGGGAAGAGAGGRGAEHDAGADGRGGSVGRWRKTLKRFVFFGGKRIFRIALAQGGAILGLSPLFGDWPSQILFICG